MKNKALAFAAAACSLAMLLGGCGSSAKNAKKPGGFLRFSLFLTFS